MGHLIWKPAMEIGFLAEDAIVNFNLLLHLVEKVENVRLIQNPASAALNNALHAIAEKAAIDSPFLFVFSKWCTAKREERLSVLVGRMFNALRDIAALDHGSVEYGLLETLASFGIKDAEHALMDEDPSLIEASIRRKDADRIVEGGASLAAAILDQERINRVAELGGICAIDANREAHVMSRDITRWIEGVDEKSRRSKQTVIRIKDPFLEEDIEVPIQPDEIIINAIEQRADINLLQKGLRNLANVAPTNPNALRYLIFFGKLDARYIPDAELENWNENDVKTLFEENPGLFEELDYLASGIGYAKPRLALMSADAKLVKQNWIASGLPQKTFIDHILPKLIQLGNESALHLLWELEGIDPDADRVIPFKKSDETDK